jgi:hypothetical protein
MVTTGEIDYSDAAIPVRRDITDSHCRAVDPNNELA